MLTDRECRAAVAKPSAYRLTDEKGLHLFITPSGYKGWRYRYRWNGQEKLLTFGAYPEVSLAEARDRRDEARLLLRKGIDPGAKSAGLAASVTLKAVAERWLALQADVWKPKHAADVRKSLEDEIFPKLGARAIATISSAEVLGVLTAIQARGATELAHRIRARLSLIFQAAMVAGEAAADPAMPLKPALKPIVERRHPALLDIGRARACLLKVESQPGFPAVKLASRLLALTAARPGMIRFAQPGDFEGLDGDEPVWRVPSAKMKLERHAAEQAAYDFLLPLSRQAAETVRVALELTGQRDYLFASASRSHRPISENALGTSYLRAGFSRIHVPHGWRSTFATIMNERAIELECAGDGEVIELMLAHKPQGVRARYVRAAYMARRRLLAQEWADLLLEGVAGPRSLLEGPRR